MSKISDERREVADRLREDASCSESSPREVVESYLGIEYDGEDVLEESYKRESILHLADLIDPAGDDTTFTLDEQSKDGEEAYPTRWWKCAMCGEETIMMYDEGAPVACPYCGAMVVSSDDKEME